MSSTAAPAAVSAVGRVRAREARVVHVNATTTTGSIMTTTARTVVEKGPFALSSRTMAMVEEGERAIARHAKCSEAATRCGPLSCGTESIAVYPSVRT